ncbi:hypothetical protein ACFQ3Z_43640 [Streptomyces nogalater]
MCRGRPGGRPALRGPRTHGHRGRAPGDARCRRRVPRRLGGRGILRGHRPERCGRTYPTPEAVEELTWWLYERGRSLSGAHYLLQIGHLQRTARALAAFHDSYDVLISAVTASPPPPLGFCAHGNPEQQLARALAFAHETPLANLTGQPCPYRCTTTRRGCPSACSSPAGTGTSTPCSPSRPSWNRPGPGPGGGHLSPTADGSLRKRPVP